MFTPESGPAKTATTSSITIVSSSGLLAAAVLPGPVQPVNRCIQIPDSLQNAGAENPINTPCTDQTASKVGIPAVKYARN